MKNLLSIAASLLAANLLVGCVDNEATEGNEESELALPRTCAELPSSKLVDGEYTLYVDGKADQPWTAYCADRAGRVKEYLTVPAGLNVSTYAGANGAEVVTEFEKLRIDPITLKLEVHDRRFATSTGTATAPNSAYITYMQLGIAMSCGNAPAFAQISVLDTAFEIVDEFPVGGAQGATGKAEWTTKQDLELSAQGDCAFVAPTKATIQLAYKR